MAKALMVLLRTTRTSCLIASETYSTRKLVDNLLSHCLVDELSPQSFSTTSKANRRSFCKLSTSFGQTTCGRGKAKANCQQASGRVSSS
ncbi:hypothetical protein Y032_0001g443 [Ancylostoma ceylanicum]|uniref:Uncharacterized protein n=1 Tax=Ancylostoma ceylanicum TaxID=53326 RepID=A0A016W5E0_9BILA|nr:hypothetical protein Y032_0001g443 [Ancylostoma ceylanicum]